MNTVTSNKNTVLPFYRLSKDLDIHLQIWTAWDDIMTLANYRVMGEALWDLMRQVENVQVSLVYQN